MNLRSFFLMIVLPLVIAVVSGIAVVHYTNSLTTPKQLVYSSASTSTFEFDEQVYSSRTFEVSNQLDEPATGVLAELKFENAIETFQIIIDSSSGETRNFDFHDSADIIIPLETIRVGEELLIKTLSLPNRSELIDFSLVSDDYVAKEVSDETLVSGFFASKLGKGAIAAAFGCIASILVFLATNRFTRANFTPAPESNDAAFVMLHTGEAEKATAMLEKTIVEKGASVFEFANLAGCYAALVEADVAKSLILAAEFINRGRHHDIIDFNRIIVDFYNGNLEAAKQQLLAYCKSKNYILYSRFSCLLRSVEQNISPALTHPSSAPR